jgi:catabolite regulation protein CreA
MSRLATLILLALYNALANVGRLFVRVDEIGSVDTEFQWLKPNHKIVINAFDNPRSKAL